MNKAELVGSIADKSGLSKAEAEGALKAFTETVEAALVNGDRISLVGFGSFSSIGVKRATGATRRPGNPSRLPPRMSSSSSRALGLTKAVN